jgi:hypothetical protein
VPALEPKDPKLLDIIKQNYLDPKISGEDENKQLLFLVCCSAFTKNPLSAIVKGPSGAGKSHLVNRVLDIFRRIGIVIEFSRITGAYLENMAKREFPPRPSEPRRKDRASDEDYRQAFYAYEQNMKDYHEQLKKPRSIDLTGKIIFIDELRGIQNAQAPKLLISEGRLRLGTVINGEPVEIEVHGTPVIITTTTLALLDDPEFENRIIPIEIDETEDQTRRVLEYESRRFADPAEDLTEELRLKALLDLFRQLEPLNIANPFAERIEEDYPTKNIEARRDFPKLLALCNVVTWLYQKQRAKAKKGLDLVFVTDLRDVETVRKLALAPLSESLAGLSKKEDKLLDAFKEAYTDQRDSFGNVTSRRYEALTVQAVVTKTRKTVRHGESWARDHINRLIDEGYLERVEQNKRPFTYCYSTLQPENLQLPIDRLRDQVKLVKSWAETYGYQVLGPIHAAAGNMPIQPQTLAREALEAESSPHSESGELTVPAGQFGEEKPRIEHLPFPTTDVGSPQLDGQEAEKLVRQAFKTEMETIGYGDMAKIRYHVREKIPDASRVTKIVGIMAKNGELSPFGADCFKLKT